MICCRGGLLVNAIAELFFFFFLSNYYGWCGNCHSLVIAPPFSKWPCFLELIVVSGLLVNAIVYVCETEGKPFFMPLLK